MSLACCLPFGLNLACMGSTDTCESLCCFACSTCGSQSVRTGCAVLCWGPSWVACVLGQPVRVCVCLSDCRWHPAVCVCWTRPKAGSCAANGHQQVCVCVRVCGRHRTWRLVVDLRWRTAGSCKQLRPQLFGRCTDSAHARHRGVPLFVAVLSAVTCRWQHQPRSHPWQPPSGCLWCTCDSVGCQLLLRGYSGDSNSRAAAAGVGTQHIQAAR